MSNMALRCFHYEMLKQGTSHLHTFECPDSYLPLQYSFFTTLTGYTAQLSWMSFSPKPLSTQPLKEQVQNHTLAPLLCIKKQVEQIALAINLRNPFIWIEYIILISECIYNQLKFESVQPVLDTCSHKPLHAGQAVTREVIWQTPRFCISCDVSAQLDQLLSQWPDSH